MKLNTTREVWIARFIGWAVLGILSCGIIFGSTFMLGPGLSAIPNLDQKIALAVFCPGADLPHWRKARPLRPPPARQGHADIRSKSPAFMQMERHA